MYAWQCLETDMYVILHASMYMVIHLHVCVCRQVCVYVHDSTFTHVFLSGLIAGSPRFIKPGLVLMVHAIYCAPRGSARSQLQ